MLKDNHIEISEAKGKPSLHLPCKAHIDHRCSIYEIRPSVCKAYTCKLLTAYQKKEITFEEAEERIRTARRLYQETRLMMGDEGNFHIVEMLERPENNVRLQDIRLKFPEKALALAALFTYIARYFYKPPQNTKDILK